MKKSGSINEYLLLIKKIVDTLAIVGALISTEDHIEAVFNGLPQEYDPFVTSVMSRSEPYTVEEMEALLMAQEERIERQKTESSAISMQANLIQNQQQYQQGSRGRGRDSNNKGGRSSTIISTIITSSITIEVEEEIRIIEEADMVMVIIDLNVRFVASFGT